MPAIRSELAIGLLIFLIGAAVGVRSVQLFRQAGGGEFFYQPEFGPAVMMACHRGLVNPDVRNAPVLSAFLAGKMDGIACADVASVPATSMSQFQAGSLYLEGAVGLTWMATGISWSRIALLDGALFGAVAALTYGILRVALRRLFALVALVLSVTSTPNLMLVPQLRDYAKGPFLLAVILIMAVLVVGSPDRRRAIGLSALCGAVVGVGVGVRTDVFIAVVPFAVAVALLLPRAVSIRTRAVALAAFVAAFIAVALPVFRGYTNGGNTGHVVLLGFAPDFGRTLRLESSIYEVIGLYNDSYGFATINGYGRRFENRGEGRDLLKADYDRAAVGYLRQIALTFPADIVVRAMAAMRVLPRYFLDSSLYPPVQVRSEWVESLYGFRNRVWWRLAPLAFIALAVATFAVGVVSTRAAWLTVLIMLGFGATAAVQFDERHFYYLAFLPWLAFGLLAEAALAFSTQWPETTTEQLRGAALILILVAAVTGAAVVSTRAYQQRSAARLFESYERAPHTPLSVETRPARENRTLFAVKEWPLSAEAARVFTRFLSVRLNDARCDASALPVTIRYEAKAADADLSQAIEVPVRPDTRRPTELFVPIYDGTDESVRFKGVEVASDRAACVDSINRVDGLEHAPLLLTTIMAADWRQERLYQRLR